MANKPPSLAEILHKRKKRKDAESIVGSDLADMLEELEEQSSLAIRSAGIDPDMLVIRDRLIDDSWQANSSHGYKKMGKDGRRADVWYVVHGGVDLELRDAEGNRFTSTSGPLGYVEMGDAAAIAERWLSGETRGFMALTDGNVIVRSRIFGAGGNGDVVDKYVNTLVGGTMTRKLNPRLEPTGPGGGTPRLASMIRRTVMAPGEAQAQIKRSAPAPTLNLAMIQQAVNVALAPLYAEVEQLKQARASVRRTEPETPMPRRVGVVPYVRAALGVDGGERPDEPAAIQPVSRSAAPNAARLELRSYQTGVGAVGVTAQPQKGGFSVRSLMRAEQGLPQQSALGVRKLSVSEAVRNADQAAIVQRNAAMGAFPTGAAGFVRRSQEPTVVFRTYESRVLPGAKFASAAGRDAFDAHYLGQPSGVPTPGIKSVLSGPRIG